MLPSQAFNGQQSWSPSDLKRKATRNVKMVMSHAGCGCRRACLALALGCVYRSKGGIALQASVGRTAGSLLAVARSSSGPTLAWLLHALWLLANAAGLALLPHVQASSRWLKLGLVDGGTWVSRIGLVFHALYASCLPHVFGSLEATGPRQ